MTNTLTLAIASDTNSVLVTTDSQPGGIPFAMNALAPSISTDGSVIISGYSGGIFHSYNVLLANINSGAFANYAALQTYFQSFFRKASGSGGGGTWGSITGTLSAQTDLAAALGAKADKTGTLAQFGATTSAQLASIISDETGSGGLVFANSATLTGVPLAPTATTGTNTLQIASCAFVQQELANATLVFSSTDFAGSGTSGSPLTVAGKVATSTTVNGKALSANITLGLASTDFANQGTTTTLLIGNASGNPSFGAVNLTSMVTGALPDGNIASASTWNAKQGAITFGTGVLTSLGVNIGSAGAPVLFNGASGTPTSLVGTNITGTAAGLTAGTVTTNANLTGPVTSSGNATTIAATSTAGNQITTAINAGTGQVNVVNLQTSTHGGFNNGPAIYEGLVATRGKVPYKLSANTQGMSRSVHFSTQQITGLKIIVPNFWVNGSFVEAGTGSSETVTASVEYPSGTYTQIKFSGSATGTVANNSTLTSDYCLVSIPTATQFWIRMYILNSGGIVYQDQQNTSALGTGGNFGTSGVVDLTMTTGGGIGAANAYVSPMAIIGYTSNASICAIGDSKLEGDNDLTSDPNANFGTICKSLNINYGYISASVPGDSLSNFIASSTNRQKAFQYASHIINAYGFNDIWNGASTAAVLANQLLVQNIGHSLNKKVYNVTVSPKTTSSDSWATTTNQTIASAPANTIRVAVNTAVRLGGNGQDGYIDLSSAVESSLNSGKWIVTGAANYATTDGIHESTAAELVIVASGVLPFNMFQTGTLVFGIPTIVAGTGAGTSPTVSVTTNGKQLQVTIVTGTLPTGTSAVVATVTLPTTLSYIPYPVFSSPPGASSLLTGASMIGMSCPSANSLTITSGTTALTASTTYVWNVII